MRCNQCEAAMINGLICHETGCTNSRSTWIESHGEWVRFVECRICEADVEVGTVCNCQTESEEL
jgi:hypothetical protein